MKKHRIYNKKERVELYAEFAYIAENGTKKELMDRYNLDLEIIAEYYEPEITKNFNRIIREKR